MWRLGEVLQRFWSVLGPFLRPSGEPPKTSKKQWFFNEFWGSGGTWGSLEAVLGRSWGVLRRSWVVLRPSLRHLDRLESILRNMIERKSRENANKVVRCAARRCEALRVRILGSLKENESRNKAGEFNPMALQLCQRHGGGFYFDDTHVVECAKRPSIATVAYTFLQALAGMLVGKPNLW